MVASREQLVRGRTTLGQGEPRSLTRRADSVYVVCVRVIGLASRPTRLGSAGEDRGSQGIAILARLLGGLGAAAILIVGLALEMQLLVLRDSPRPVRIERQPVETGDIERINVEIWPTGEVWIQGRWLGVWVRDGRVDRWVGESVESEIARLVALAPEVNIEIDFDDEVPPDLVWRVVDQVGLDHLIGTYDPPQLPELPTRPEVTA